VGLPEEDVIGKQDGAGFILDLGMFGVGKQVGAGCNRAYVGSQENDVGKQDGGVRKGSRMWPQDCQPCGLVEGNG